MQRFFTITVNALSPFYTRFFSIVYSMLIAVASVLIDRADAVSLALIILVFLMAGDYLSAIYVSVYKRKLGIKSHRTQWTLAKYAIYSGALIGSLILGVLLHSFFCILNSLPLESPTYILQFSLHLTVAIMLLIMWNESVSITENILLVHPKNKVVLVLHYFLAFELVKKIPLFNLSKFYKVDKDENKHIIKDNDNTL